MQEARLLQAQVDNTFVLKLTGDVRLSVCCTLDNLLQPVVANQKITQYLIDLTEAENLDSTTLGLLAKLAIHAQNSGLQPPHIFTSNPDITHLLESMGFRQYFMFFNQPLNSPEELAEVEQLACDEEHIKNQVLAAHKTLMSLNTSNQEAFANLVNQLENCEQAGCNS